MSNLETTGDDIDEITEMAPSAQQLEDYKKLLVDAAVTLQDADAPSFQFEAKST